MIPVDLNLFEKETGLTIEVDEDYYDEQYGNNRFKVTSDMSLMEVGTRLDTFNQKYCRKIVPNVIGNEIFIYL